jgi:hypothetical protein
LPAAVIEIAPSLAAIPVALPLEIAPLITTLSLLIATLSLFIATIPLLVPPVTVLGKVLFPRVSGGCGLIGRSRAAPIILRWPLRLRRSALRSNALWSDRLWTRLRGVLLVAAVALGSLRLRDRRQTKG